MRIGAADDSRRSWHRDVTRGPTGWLRSSAGMTRRGGATRRCLGAWSHGLGGALNGPDDSLVPGAATEVAGERVEDLVPGGVGMLSEVGVHGHDESGGAEPALQAVLGPERFLNGAE